MWQEYLVFVDGSEDGLARLKLAQDVVTKRGGGKLEAVVLSRLPGPPFGVAAEAMTDIYEADVAKARAESGAALEALKAIAGADVHLHVVECPYDDANETAARLARTADLVMIGKPEELDDSDLDTKIYLGVVLEGGRPCLMFPRWINPHAWGRRAVISWKGSPESARATQAALPFLKECEAVRLCVANPRTEREGEDETSIARVATYLTRHGVKVGEPVMRESWEGPERMIVSEVEGFNADLLVIGAYDQGRLTEELFGGVTARMVRDATIPILLAH